MARYRWKRPVKVHIRGREDPEYIHTVFEAAQVCCPKLVETKGPMVTRAITAILAVMEGKADAEEARDAFVEGMMEAGFAGQKPQEHSAQNK
jgi:hypothetical protein